MKKAKDVMNKELISISPDTDFRDVLNIMKEKGIGKIPVLEGEKVLGVITRDDILVKEEKMPLPPVIAFWDILINLPNDKEFKDKLNKIKGIKASEIMEKNYYKAMEEDTLEEIITDMLEKNYSYCIIFDDNNFLKGIITKTDLIKNCF